jgi:Zn-finger nucleic acid-binding protein
MITIFKKRNIDKSTMEDKKLLCPRCLSFGNYIVMTKKTRNKITIDKCKKCGGLFLDKEEQNHILKLAKGGKNGKD